MATTAPTGTVGHDQAAQILRISPAELTKLVGAGVVPRVMAGAYQPGVIIGAYIEHIRADADQLREQLKRAQPRTQDEVAHYLDISDRRLRELLAEWGISHKQAVIDDLRVRYIRKLREEAAGRVSMLGDDEIDLVTERAKLAREQRIKLELANTKVRGEQADIELLGDVLATASQAVANRIDALPAAIMRACPDLPEGVLRAIETTTYNARAEWSRKTAALVMSHLDLDDGDDDDTAADHDPDDA